MPSTPSSTDENPIFISRDEMVLKFEADGIHPDSPAGRRLAMGSMAFQDGAGRVFKVSPGQVPQSQSGRVPTHPAGARDPITGLRPGQDLGDGIVERLFGGAK